MDHESRHSGISALGSVVDVPGTGQPYDTTRIAARLGAALITSGRGEKVVVDRHAAQLIKVFSFAEMEGEGKLAMTAGAQRLGELITCVLYRASIAMCDVDEGPVREALPNPNPNPNWMSIKAPLEKLYLTLTLTLLGCRSRPR